MAYVNQEGAQLEAQGPGQLSKPKASQSMRMIALITFNSNLPLLKDLCRLLVDVASRLRFYHKSVDTCCMCHVDTCCMCHESEDVSHEVCSRHCCHWEKDSLAWQ